MTGLRPLWRHWRLFILSWALKELSRTNPCHPDIPQIVLELSYWREQ